MRHLVLVLSLIATGPALAETWSKPEFSGLLADPALDELSGLAASRRHPERLWGINDSGNEAHLVAITPQAKHVATLRVTGVGNKDWEDLASFSLGGRHYLMIADTGDNGGVRDVLSLHFVEEPAEPQDQAGIQPAWTVRFRWPDGARDCEAAAVDPVRGEVLLVSKKRVPPELFRVPLRPARDEVQVAERIGLLQGIPQPGEEQLRRNPVYGRYRSQVSAADLSADGNTLAVMNYHAIFLYGRAAGSDWAGALARPRQVLAFPWLPQAEAVAFSRDGRRLYVGSEQTPVPLLRFRRIR